MSSHARYGLSHVINAAGSFTPLGVSRSSASVAHAAGEALTHFFIIDQLQDALSAAISRFTGAEARAAVHCVAASITLSIAAAMTGMDQTRIASLPDTQGMPNRVVIPAGLVVNYGHPIEQDIRLAGATPIFAGSAEQCSAQDICSALAHPDVACLLLVSSRLVRGQPVDLGQAVAEAQRRGVPVIIDGAAQNMSIASCSQPGRISCWSAPQISSLADLRPRDRQTQSGRRGPRSAERHRPGHEAEQGSDYRRADGHR